GALTVHAGTTDQGQGHRTMYAQILHDHLGIERESVRVLEGDTDAIGLGLGAGGSRVSAMGGSAAVMAAQKIIAKGRVIAAHRLEAAEADIEFRNGGFQVTGTDMRLSFKDVARIAHSPAQLPDNLEPGLSEKAVYRSTVENFPNGCHVCEVEIAPDTGVA